MKKTWLLVIGALAIINLSGCAARSLSVLQNDFNAAVKAKVQCGSGNEKKLRDPLCLVDHKVIFADIADQTKESISKYRSGDSVKIALYRLRAYSLWQSGAESVRISEAKEKGLNLCAQKGYHTAPRDCALLKTVGLFQEIESMAARISKAKERMTAADASGRKKLCSDNVATWRTQAGDYWNNQYKLLVDAINDLEKKEGVPVNVINYLNSQKRAAQKPFVDLYTIAFGCVPSSSDRDLVGKCPCGPTKREGHAADCAKVYDSQKQPMSLFHEATCLKKAMRQY